MATFTSDHRRRTTVAMCPSREIIVSTALNCHSARVDSGGAYAGEAERLPSHRCACYHGTPADLGVAALCAIDVPSAP